MTTRISHLQGTPSTVEKLQVRGLLDVVDGMARAYAVTRTDILGRGRSKQVAAARHAVMQSLRKMGLSYPEIGWLLDRDHTSVMSACRKPGPFVRVA